MAGSFRIEVIRIIRRSSPLSVEIILRVERMTHAEKIQHWCGGNPWKGMRLPRQIKPIKPGHVFLDSDGKIMKMPSRIGRPCFGQVPAVLRHGGNQPFWNPRTRTMMLSRCMRCPVRAACEHVVDERLRVTPEIDQTYREWKHAGGREATWTDVPGGLARIKYRDLLQLLRTTVQFSSQNDDDTVAHYEKLVEARREKDRQRQRLRRVSERMKRTRAGELDSKVEQVLHGQRIWRQIEHMQAWKDPKGPRQLKQAPVTSSIVDARVWLAKTRIELRGGKANASNTAREIQSLGFELHRSHNALRDAVGRSLSRVALLERTAYPHRQSAIWPRFGPRELRDALAFNPLQTLELDSP